MEDLLAIMKKTAMVSRSSTPSSYGASSLDPLHGCAFQHYWMICRTVHNCATFFRCVWSCILSLLATANDLLHCTHLCNFSSVWIVMDFECTSPTKRFAALSTLVELFCRMGKLVNLQTCRMVKCFLALVTFAKFLSTAVGCNKVHKGSGVCLWTQVTRIGLCYPKVWTLCTEWSSGTEDVMSAST